MTQPRKEQIKDIQAKFSQLNPSLLATGSNPWSPNLGFGPATTYTTSGSALSTFLQSTVTQAFGGVADTSPGVLLGTNQGPFVLSNGQQFSITIPQINGGAAITVTIQSSDVVNLGGSPVVTTSLLAARINTALASALSAASLSGPVATNFNGFLRFQTPTTGDSAAITVTDVTAGLLNVFFGSTASPSIHAVGSTAPKRGIVTISPDGQGGRVAVRLINGQPCITQQSKRLNMGSGVYVPDVDLGKEIYAKISGVTGVSATIAFFTTDNLQPSIVTAGGALSTLSGSDTVTITVTEPNIFSPQVLTVTFSSITPSSTVQNVIDAINAQWNALGSTPNVAVCTTEFTTFVFPSGSSFNLKLNGNASINVPTGPSVITATNLANAINSAISTAGQSAQGHAAVTGGGEVAISSLNTDGSQSSIELIAGPPLASFQPPDMTSLDGMGLAAGVYHGTTIAQLYGADEIRIYNPSRGPGASIAIAGSGPTLGRLGVTAGTVGVILGEEPAIPNASVRVLIPEEMEFGEIPVDHDINLQKFLSTNQVTSLDVTQGIKNAGQPIVVGPDGQIPTSGVTQNELTTLGVEITAETSRATTAEASLASSIATVAAAVVTETNRAEAEEEILSSNLVPGLRLTLTTGTPVTITDVTGAGTLYYTPYYGDTIALYNGTNWVRYQTAEISLVLTALSSGFNYDVFAFYTGSAVALELAVWSTDTVRATALAFQDGIIVKGGDATRRYIGTIRTTGTATTEDSNKNRFVWNFYMREQRSLAIGPPTASIWGYTNPNQVWRPADNNPSAASFNFVAGFPTYLEATAQGSGAPGDTSSDDGGIGIGVGVDSQTVNSAQIYGSFNGLTTAAMTIRGSYVGSVGIGFHTIYWLETGVGSATSYSFNGGVVPTVMKMGMIGMIRA